MTDQRAQAMRLETLKSQIASATYTVDERAVADALLRAGARHTRQGLAGGRLIRDRSGARSPQAGSLPPRV